MKMIYALFSISLFTVSKKNTVKPNFKFANSIILSWVIDELLYLSDLTKSSICMLKIVSIPLQHHLDRLTKISVNSCLRIVYAKFWPYQSNGAAEIKNKQCVHFEMVECLAILSR